MSNPVMHAATINFKDLLEGIEWCVSKDGPVGNMDVIDAMLVFAACLILTNYAGAGFESPDPDTLSEQIGQLISTSTLLMAPIEGEPQ